MVEQAPEFEVKNDVGDPQPIKVTGLDINGTEKTVGTYRDSLKTFGFIADQELVTAAITNQSELHVVNRLIEVEAKFYYVINTRKTSTANLNGGTITVSNRQALLQTSTATNGRAFIRTRDAINYKVSQAIEFTMTAAFPDVTGTAGNQVGPANCKMVIGVQAASETDGIVMGFDNGSRFFVEYKNGGSATRILATSFNRDRLDGVTTVNNELSEYAPDFTKIQLFRVMYSWHGASPFVFQIQKPDGTWRTYHQQSFVNVLTVASIGIPVLPASALVENTGKNTNTRLVLQAAQISSLGNASTTAGVLYFNTSKAQTVSTEAPVLTIRNKSTYASSTNFIDCKVSFLSLASSGNKPVQFRLLRDATLTGASYVDVDTNDSCTDIDQSATAASGGTGSLIINIGPNDSFSNSVRDLGLILRPGETLTLLASSASSNDIRAAIRWEENH